jgi:DNA replicative helicase MCM subunit Mcm2 (Cdc46/Mcm family)
MEDDCYLTREGLIKYINYAKTFAPKLSDEAKILLLDIYEKMRNVSAKSDIPIGTRQLEAIVRLSMAYAKLNFSNEVKPDDINIIKILIEKQYEAFGSSISQGGIQTQLFVDGKSVKEHDILTVWNSCKNIEGKVKLAEFEKALVSSGMSLEKAENTITKWETNGAIKLGGDGTYTRI